ncbi:hypothetical protein MHK_004709, partial [Candidatus Magnetomorum sp. HK-1]
IKAISKFCSPLRPKLLRITLKISGVSPLDCLVIKIYQFNYATITGVIALSALVYIQY